MEAAVCPEPLRRIALPIRALGVEVDEKKLEEEAKKPQTYKWPGAKLKDGSVSDY